MAKNILISSGEVSQARSQLSEEHEAKVEALRDALIEGEQSGSPTSFDFDAFIADKTSS